MPEINNSWTLRKQTDQGGWVEVSWWPMEKLVTINGDAVPDEKQIDLGEVRAIAEMQKLQEASPNVQFQVVKMHVFSAPKPGERNIYITETYTAWQ